MSNANNAFKQPSNRVSRFAQVPQARIPRSVFNLNHTVKGTIEDAGLLQPFDLYEIEPGSTFRINPTIFVRLTTQLVPIMDNMYLDTFYFFVPNRLVWEHWQNFMGERKPDPDSSIDYTIPQIVAPETGWGIGSLADCFGLPIGNEHTDKMEVCAFPFRGYNLIWNEWFRDQNLQDSRVVDLDDGDDDAADYNTLARRCKRADYFTTAQTQPQKGDAVELPMTGDAPVVGIGYLNQTYPDANKAVWETEATGTRTYANANSITGENEWYVEGTAATGGKPKIYADLSGTTAATINQLREAVQIQRLLERDQRSGTRYVELLRAHYGVTSPDSRLMRPEFLGGNSVPFNQATVAQTTYQGTETRLDAKGSLAANSVFVSRGAGIHKSFVEHGYVIGLMNIRADITYQQGIDRHWLRQNRYDYYFPVLSCLGEQVVESREIWWEGRGSATADPPTYDYSVFGYQERFAEMRFAKSYICGALRSDFSTPLDYWHLSQDFAARPTLSDAFIQDTPPVSRVTAVTPSASSPAFVFDAFIECKAVRPMPTYGVPGMMDHF